MASVPGPVVCSDWYPRSLCPQASVCLRLYPGGKGKPADIIFKEEFMLHSMLDSLEIPDNLLLLGANAFNMS